ncbi:MAG: 5,6-dimethylbenzimidazole synthase, partial [Colwellia sp.]
LMARAMNIGLGWVSILDPEAVKEILKAPVKNKLVAYLCLGYVKEFFTSPELEKLNWEKRKELKTLVHKDCYSD